MSLTFLMRAAEPVCRAICTAAYFEEYRRKYFPELFEVPVAQLPWEQALQYLSEIDPRLALGITAGATLAVAGTTYLLKNKNGKAVVEQLPAPGKPLTDILEEELKQQQLEEAARQEALRQQQLEEAARQEALRQQQLEEAARQEALRQQQLEEAARQEALRQQQLEEAARQEALRKQQIEEAARQEALRQQQEESARKAKQQQEAKRRAQEQAEKISVDVVALSQPQGAVAQRSRAEELSEQSQRLVEAQEALAKQAPRALPVVVAPVVQKAEEPTTVKERMARARKVAQSETALKLQQMPVRMPAAAAAPKKEEKTEGQKLAVTPLVTAYLASTKGTPLLRQRFKMPHEKNKVVNEVLAALHSNGSVPTSAQEIAEFNQGIEELEAALDAKLEQTQAEADRAALLSHKSTVHSYRM